MEKVLVSARIKASILEQIEALVGQEEKTKSQVIERLLEMALSQTFESVNNRIPPSTKVDTGVYDKLRDVEERLLQLEYKQQGTAVNLRNLRELVNRDRETAPLLVQGAKAEPPETGLTDAQLAEKLGKSDSTVNRWRNGKTKLPAGLGWQAKDGRWFPTP